MWMEYRFLAGGSEKSVLDEWVVKIGLLASGQIYSSSLTRWPID